MAKAKGKAKDELIWGNTQEEFAEYVRHLENSNLRAIVEERVARAVFRLPPEISDETLKEIHETMEPVENEELAHLDHYVRMVDECNARYNEVVRPAVEKKLERHKAQFDKKLEAYAHEGEGIRAYTTGVRRAVKREGKKMAADLGIDIDKTLDSVLEEYSIELVMNSMITGGGVLKVLRDFARYQHSNEELEKWKAKHPKDIFVTHDAEINARDKMIHGIMEKYFKREGCGGDCAGCGGSCG